MQRPVGTTARGLQARTGDVVQRSVGKEIGSNGFHGIILRGETYHAAVARLLAHGSVAGADQRPDAR